jgi:transcriptional regulator with XRE-family HTH domain
MMADMDATSIGKRLRWARRRAGMTQDQLAQTVGMPQPSVARIERGTVSPRTATLVELMAATGHRLTVEPIGPAVDTAAVERRLRMAVPQRIHQALGRANALHRIIKRLRRFRVPFVLIGELAEAAHGSPTRAGQTVEICHASTDVARERLSLALAEADPAVEVRLVTETAAGDGYDVLARNATGMHVDAGILVQVASLDDLLRIRLARGTPEDREAAEVLRAIIGSAG